MPIDQGTYDISRGILEAIGPKDACVEDLIWAELSAFKFLTVFGTYKDPISFAKACELYRIFLELSGFNSFFHEFPISYYPGVLHLLDSVEVRLQRIASILEWS